MDFTPADSSFTFPENLQSGQRVAVILTLPGSDTEFYAIGDDLTEQNVRRKLDDTDRRLAAIVNVE